MTEFFKHDIYCLSDPELKSLVREFKSFGYAVYFAGIEILYQANGKKVDLTEFCLSIKENLRETEDELPNILNVVQSAVDKDLFSSEENLVYSQRVTEACEVRSEVKAKCSEAGKQGMKTRWGDNTSNNPPYNPPYKEPYNLPNNPPITEKRREEKKREDIKESTKERETLSSSVSAFVESFNKTCISLPRVLSVSDKRRNGIKACYKAFEDKIFEVPAKVEASDFLTGRSGKWKASFDWLINTNNMRKVIEGNYDNHDEPQTKRSHMVTDNAERAKGVNSDGSLSLR